jgi:hypothetical protein
MRLARLTAPAILALPTSPDTSTRAQVAYADRLERGADRHAIERGQRVGHERASTRTGSPSGA